MEEARDSLESANESLDTKKKSCESIKENINACNRDISLLDEKIKSIPAELIDVMKVQEELQDKKNQVVCISEEIEELSSKRENDKTTYQRILDFESQYDQKALFEKQETANELLEELTLLEKSLAEQEGELERNSQKTNLLNGIPCGSSYPTCKFIKDAYIAKAKLPKTKEEVSKLQDQIEDLNDEIKQIDPEEVEDHVNKYKALINKKNSLSNQITTYDLQIEKNESIIKGLMTEINLIEEKLSEYELNKETIENLGSFNKKMKNLKFRLATLENKYENCNSSILDLYKEVGSLEKTVAFLEEQKNEFLDLQEEHSAADLYQRCMHPNGIAYDVIKRKLPVINEEIAKILANIVEFEVFFEDDGKRLDIFIKHPSYDPRPLEMGSGAEKTIAAMAIRLALLSVSSLPKSDIFILDEPGTALDEENMHGFIQILDLIKSYFKTVLLISHLDSLKDCVDMQITIEKKNGYASVNV